jgi:hypothetical protein
MECQALNGCIIAAATQASFCTRSTSIEMNGVICVASRFQVRNGRQ